MIDGGAFIAGILTRGTDIVALRHLGRRPTALQRTVLEWETAGTCAVEGCTNNVRIEIDHVDPWAHTHLTDIDQLAGICSRCHRRKTHHGYNLGPRLPTGKRHLHPPGEHNEQHGLFDTS
jgi:5-methylcytosine-specific restriction endonuclease McrA